MDFIEGVGLLLFLELKVCIKLILIKAIVISFRVFVIIFLNSKLGLGLFFLRLLLLLWV